MRFFTTLRIIAFVVSENSKKQQQIAQRQQQPPQQPQQDSQQDPKQDSKRQPQESQHDEQGEKGQPPKLASVPAGAVTKTDNAPEAAAEGLGVVTSSHLVNS